MAVTNQPLLSDGQWIAGKGGTVPVMDKFRLEPGAHVTTADREQVAQAVAAAHAAFRRGAPGPFERGAILERAAQLRPDDEATRRRLERARRESTQPGVSY